MTRESVRRAIRTFIPSFLTLLVPGLLGWLNALTEWANNEGATPFPDARGLAYVLVAAIVAGFISVVNGVMNAVEDATGHGILREVPKRARTATDERGGVYIGAGALVGLLLIILILILVF